MQARGDCADCHLEHVLDELLPADATVDLAPLRESLIGTENARSVLGWLGKGGSRTLATLVDANQPITHDLLDNLQGGKELDHLRALLASAGILEERSEHLERIERWIQDRCAVVPRSHSNLVRPFAQWTLLRRARQRDVSGKFTEGSAKWLRQRVTAALHFLRFLDEHSTTLEQADQKLMDLYLAAGNTRRYVVRDFIHWAHRRRLCAKLTIPLRQPQRPAERIDDDARWDLLTRFLHDDAIKLHVRVAGAFALLYGQHLSRITAWTTDRVNVEDGVTKIRMAQVPIDVPEPLGALLAKLVSAPRGKALVGRNDTAARWIFPGGLPGRHITTERLRQDLAEVGLVLRPSRNTALAEFASDVPSAVLAGLLGLHINTAVAWSRSMQQDWNAFVAHTRDAYLSSS
ncbi:hypothetical protein AB0G04_16295 [Actinoplanes sp. NPDC023801]|uniref:hypothetical protein n=1 Tax=Actinoplanes sp. NPDC023801 TaxID=3154595 RepID=UPI003409EDED